jgi:hypothetical protein
MRVMILSVHPAIVRSKQKDELVPERPHRVPPLSASGTLYAPLLISLSPLVFLRNSSCPPRDQNLVPDDDANTSRRTMRLDQWPCLCSILSVRDHPVSDHHPRFGRRCGGCSNEASERSHTSPSTQSTRPPSR